MMAVAGGRRWPLIVLPAVAAGALLVGAAAWLYLGSDWGLEVPQSGACEDVPGGETPAQQGIRLDDALAAAKDHVGPGSLLLYARGQEPLADLCAFGGTPASWNLYLRDANGTQGGLSVSEDAVVPVGAAAQEGDTLPDYWRQHPLVDDWVRPERLVDRVNGLLESATGPAENLTYELRMLGDRAVWIVTTSGGVAPEPSVFVLDALDGRDLTGEVEVAVPGSRARELVLANHPELAGWDAWSMTMYAETAPGIPYSLYSSGYSYARHLPVVAAHDEGPDESSTWVFEFHDAKDSGQIVAYAVFGGEVFGVASLPWANDAWAIEGRGELIAATAGKVLNVTVEEARAEAAARPGPLQSADLQGLGLQWSKVRLVNKSADSVDDARWLWQWFLWHEEDLALTGAVQAVRGGYA